MKKLTNVQSVVKDGKVTITADITDIQPHEFRFPAEQRTIGHLHPSNPRHPRHIQISGEAVFVKGNGFKFAIANDDLVAIATAVEPRTSYRPWFDSVPSPEKLSVEFSSELTPNIQWKWSDLSDPNGKWSDIAGATGTTLTNSPELKGKWVSCIAWSEAGATSTPPIKL